jgi:nicotinamide phosphoribosyltransferase
MSTTTIAPRITTASPIAALLDADGYKTSHIKIFEGPNRGDRPSHGDNTGTTRVLINWTNRSNHYQPNSSHAVVFGLQAFAQSYLTEAWAPFFAADADEVCDLYEKALLAYLGPNNIGSDHIRALHTLGYLPLKIKALPEGTLALFGIATLTIENTHDAFFWLPNYIETALSASIWHPATTATTSLEYRDLLEAWAIKTDPAGLAGVDFQAHDFSMRGQTSLESAAASAAGHLLNFLGTDTMSSFDFVDRFYPGDNGWVAASVPATEHSVMCVRGEQGELATFTAILDAFPTGIVSAVSDGYDLWKVITEVLPQLKDRILARDGKLVIRPDSGDPVDILCGEKIGHWEEMSNYGPVFITEKRAGLTPAEKGVVELLDDLFGHTVNEQGYKVLNSKIGVIYGDSITLARAKEIFERLEAKGYASTNVVLGIGSYTFQMTTRDALGSAVKATWALVDGLPVDIQKDPVTGSGKKSAKGRIVVFRNADGELGQYDEATEAQVENESLLETVWEDGRFLKLQSFADVRAVLKAERAARADRRSVI